MEPDGTKILYGRGPAMVTIDLLKCANRRKPAERTRDIVETMCAILAEEDA